jgi:LytS/YehU family sensor histidine kinase
LDRFLQCVEPGPVVGARGGKFCGELLGVSDRGADLCTVGLELFADVLGAIRGQPQNRDVFDGRNGQRESRIHPHFLFNTLNSISSLIPEDPARAERLLEQMAALLRFSLDASQSGLVPLSRELKIVTDYLEIERARFGDRLRYHFDVAANAGDAQVPPLAVQTLVENSVKFAVAASRVGGDIRIAGARDNGLLRVEVSDDGPSFQLESAPAGHGLDNLKGRLAALFGEQAALTVERRENRNSVCLAVPQAANDHESIPG